MNNDKKNAFASYHIRQSIGISLLSIALRVLLSFADLGQIGDIIGLAPLVLAIFGIINASKLEEKPVPILGDQFNEWFKGIA